MKYTWRITTVCPHCRKDNVEDRSDVRGDFAECKCKKCGKVYNGLIVSRDYPTKTRYVIVIQQAYSLFL